MAIDKAISYRQQAAFGGIMGRDGRRMYGGGSDMGSVGTSSRAAGPGTGGYQGGPQGGYGDAGSSNNPSGDRYRSSRREYQQAVNNAAAIEAAKKAKEKRDKRDAKNKNITKFGYNKPKSKLGGILGTIAGMMMGIPGLGLLTGGLGKLGKGLGSLNDKIQNSDFGRSKTLMDYLDAKKYGGIDARDRKANQTMREARGIQTAMDMRPTTLDPREMARVGLQMPTAPMSKPTFSDPFRNTVETTTKVNAPSNDAVSSVTPETGFFENQFNKFFSGPEFDAYNAVRTDKYANAPSKFDYDFNTNKAAMQMINDKITNNAKGTIFEGLPSELASVIGNIAAVPGSIPASLAHEFVQSRERVQDQFKGASPSIMAEGPSIGDYYSGFMNENPFATAGTRALGIGAALPDALGKVGKTISDAFISPAASAEVRPAIGMENTGLGFSIPTGDVGFNASGRLGNLSATVDAIDALKGESVNPQINYSGDFGNTNVFGNYSDDVQNLGLNFNNDKGLSGGISYDAITGEPRFDIGFRRTFADGGLASMFTRRG